MKSRYAEWLAGQGVPLYSGGGVKWHRYQEALVPVEGFPLFVHLEPEEEQRLLKESGAWLLRYSSDPTETETAWWYVVCDSYDIGALKSRRRKEIKRGHRHCAIRMLSPDWLAEHGYECYRAAFESYRGAKPDDREEYQQTLLSCIGGPFEYWGAFADGELVGYTKCVVEENYVAIVFGKFDPNFRHLYATYALFDSMLSHYVTERGMAVNVGYRSVLHDSNIQDFCRNKFGFRNLFCRLNIGYQTWLAGMVSSIYPFRRFVYGMPPVSKMRRLQALMVLEECRRRSCAPIQ